MTVIEIRDALSKMVAEGYGDLELECSVDMSIEGEEETYRNRVFGIDPYLVRYNILEEGRVAQILFENGSSNFGIYNVER